MFSGIVETTARVAAIREEGGNRHFTLECPFTDELKIDQSIAHNGVCLTVVSIEGDRYTTTAIRETLLKSNLGGLTEGDLVNLERSMRPDALLDGHIVQGHVDQTARCTAIREADGSWYYTFEYDPSAGNITVEKGSVAVNGVSLTVVNSAVRRWGSLAQARRAAADRAVRFGVPAPGRRRPGRRLSPADADVG